MPASKKPEAEPSLSGSSSCEDSSASEDENSVDNGKNLPPRKPKLSATPSAPHTPVPKGSAPAPHTPVPSVSARSRAGTPAKSAARVPSSSARSRAGTPSGSQGAALVATQAADPESRKKKKQTHIQKKSVPPETEVKPIPE